VPHPLAISKGFFELARFKDKRDKTVEKLAVEGEVIFKKLTEQKLEWNASVKVLLPATRAVVDCFFKD